MRVSTAAKMTAALLLPLLLAACFFIPGKFTSSMTVEKNGKFSFAYKGEIIAFPSDKATGEKPTEATFEPSCSTDEGDSRDCSAAEIATQRKEWDEDSATRAARKKSKEKEEGEAAMAMLGFNPNDPKSIDAFIAKLRQQKGWRSVVHKGDGVFEVDYAISGTLDRDFVFPLIPDVALSPPFVVARVRNDNNVMIEAPGFGNKGEKTSSSAISAMAAGGGSSKPDFAIDGSFTVTTNAEILTNNTDAGPQADASRAGWRTMNWPVTLQSKKVPETLVRIQP